MDSTRTLDGQAVIRTASGVSTRPEPTGGERTRETAVALFLAANNTQTVAPRLISQIPAGNLLHRRARGSPFHRLNGIKYHSRIVVLVKPLMRDGRRSWSGFLGQFLIRLQVSQRARVLH
jgi:hypothetical protein